MNLTQSFCNFQVVFTCSHLAILTASFGDLIPSHLITLVLIELGLCASSGHVRCSPVPPGVPLKMQESQPGPNTLPGARAAALQVPALPRKLSLLPRCLYLSVPAPAGSLWQNTSTSSLSSISETRVA